MGFLHKAVAAVREELLHNATHPGLLEFVKDVLPRIEKTGRNVTEPTRIRHPFWDTPLNHSQGIFSFWGHLNMAGRML